MGLNYLKANEPIRENSLLFTTKLIILLVLSQMVRAKSFFIYICFFCSHFEELQTMLFKVELIITNKPLTYVYPNTIETPYHLLFGRQL